jgi:hypothetical protein
MENAEDRPSAAEAQAALESVAESRMTLAPYVRSPWWLYPAQGVGTAAFVVGLAFTTSHPAWGTSLLAVAIVVLGVLPMVQQRPGRLVLDVYTHRGSRGSALVYVLLFALVVATALVLNAYVTADWIVYLAGAAAFVLTVVMGPIMDSRLERAIRAGR